MSSRNTSLRRRGSNNASPTTIKPLVSFYEKQRSFVPETAEGMLSPLSTGVSAGEFILTASRWVCSRHAPRVVRTSTVLSNVQFSERFLHLRVQLGSGSDSESVVVETRDLLLAFISSDALSKCQPLVINQEGPSLVFSCYHVIYKTSTFHTCFFAGEGLLVCLFACF